MNVAALNFSTREFAKIFGSTKKRTAIKIADNTNTLTEVVLLCDKRPTQKMAEITEVRTVRLGALTLSDVIEHGYDSLLELKTELIQKYRKNIGEHDVISIIRFEFEGD